MKIPSGSASMLVFFLFIFFMHVSFSLKVFWRFEDCVLASAIFPRNMHTETRPKCYFSCFYCTIDLWEEESKNISKKGLWPSFLFSSPSNIWILAFVTREGFQDLNDDNSAWLSVINVKNRYSYNTTLMILIWEVYNSSVAKNN